MEQWLFPERAEQLFRERVSPLMAMFTVAYVDLFFALPGWLAMANPLQQPAPITLAAPAACELPG